MLWDAWMERWNAALEACILKGGMTIPLELNGPAAEEEIIAVELQLQIALPSSFRAVLKEFASSVHLYWSLPDEFTLPFVLREIFAGECYWNLTKLVDWEKERRDWIANAFQDPEDDYSRVWHNKLAFAGVGNGDMLALDLTLAPQPVVYLSHDGGDGHGYQLGADFADFIDRSSLLGCVGYEDWQMMPFLASSTALLDPECENARLWRGLLGLKFSTED